MTMRQDPYHTRMKRVLNYIDRHLEDDLGLDTLSAVAALSKYHFHRQFRGYFGISVHRYVQLVRMKRAGQVLAFKDEASVTETALDVGYDAPDAFARAFRKSFGQLPSAFRDTPDWEVWFASLWPLTNARSKLMKTAYSLADVNIIDVPETPVAVLQHRGNPALVRRDYPEIHRLAKGCRFERGVQCNLHCVSFGFRHNAAGRIPPRHLCSDRSENRDERPGRGSRCSSGRTMCRASRNRRRKCRAGDRIPVSRLVASKR